MEAGFVDGDFQNLYTDNEETLGVVAHPLVRGVKFTGSTAAGRLVAQQAGAHLKKGCFELGGADPFIVLEDSDLGLAVEKAYISRMVNNGQACINAKRFIVVEQVYEEFVAMLREKIITATVMGDPLRKEVNLGPLVSQRQADTLRKQVQDSKASGCKEVALEVDMKNLPSSNDTSCFFKPTMLENIAEESPAFSLVLRPSVQHVQSGFGRRCRRPSQRVRVRPRRRHLQQGYRESRACGPTAGRWHALRERLRSITTRRAKRRLQELWLRPRMLQGWLP